MKLIYTVKTVTVKCINIIYNIYNLCKRINLSFDQRPTTKLTEYNTIRWGLYFPYFYRGGEGWDWIYLYHFFAKTKENVIRLGAVLKFFWEIDLKILTLLAINR